MEMTNSIATLRSLKTALNKLHSNVERHLQSAKQDAAEAGEKLCEVKAILKHGDFKPWIEENCDFGERTAQRYMKCAKVKNDTHDAFDAAESINEVMELGDHPKLIANYEKFIASGTESNDQPKSIQQMMDDGFLVPIPSDLPSHGYFISEKYKPTAAASTVISGAASLYCHGNETTKSLKEYIMGGILNNSSRAMKDYEVNSLLHLRQALNEMSGELEAQLLADTVAT
jgi:hypothetical protein